MSLSEDQITQLAPDSSSVKAGQQLANNSKWVTKFIHEKALWGDCQGSGKYPYRTMVDLQNIAFKCSCPSRKFPCKHGLGLLYLYARTPNVFEETTSINADVEEWLNKRTARSEVKETKETKETTKKTDPKAQEKRAEEREKKVSAGLEELRTWLQDLVRNGIHQIPSQAHSFNRNIAARMVDTQAAGVANSLKRLSQLNYYQEGWQKHFLRKISSLYLLTEGYRNIEQLPVDLQADVRTLIGWNTTKEQVLQQKGISDTWAILGRELEEDDRLTTERLWLYGYQSQHFALVLNFYPQGQMPQHSLLVGSAIHAEVVFYPSSIPLRALIKEQQGVSRLNIPSAEPDFSSLLQKVANTFSIQPFSEQLPFLVNYVRISVHQEKWYLLDQANQSLALLNAEVDGWRVLATTAGQAFLAFITYEPEGARLLAYWMSDNFYFLA